MRDQKRVLQFGDIIQIKPWAKVAEPLLGALAIVEEVRTWGVTAMVDAIGSDKVITLKPCGYAFVRLQWDEFFLTGGKAEVFKHVPEKEERNA